MLSRIFIVISLLAFRSLALLLNVLLWMVKVHCDIVTFVTVSLIVMDHSTCIASEEELHVLGQLYAGDSGFMIIKNTNYLAPRIKIEDANLVIKITAYVEKHISWSAHILEVGE